MPEKKARIFSREFKLEAVSRMQSGENVSALSRELGKSGSAQVAPR